MYTTQRIDDVAVAIYDPIVSGGWVALNSITNSSLEYSVPKSNLNILGAKTSSMITNGPVDVSLRVTQILNSDSPFSYPQTVLAYTGLSNLQFHVSLDFNPSSYASDNGIDLISGAIRDYSVGVQVGELPMLSTDYIFADSDFFAPSQTASTTGMEMIATIPATGIQLNLGNQAGTNVITSANLSASFHWIKEGRINSPSTGSKFFLELSRPVEYNATVDLLLEDYMFDQYSFVNPKTFSLSIYGETSHLTTLTVPNAELVGESVSLNNEGNQVITLQYKGVG